MNQPIAQISVEDLAARLAQSADSLQLIDVRESHEIAIAYIPGFAVLSLSEFAEWSAQITARFKAEAETFVICHHGMRSAQMCQWLQQVGFTNVKNIAGGIDAYSQLVDSNIPRY
jgi:rhodanese-related sulfurtransferase